MQEYNHYVLSRGEAWVQALIEQIERVSGIRINLEAPVPLEDRWNVIMAKPLPQNQSINK